MKILDFYRGELRSLGMAPNENDLLLYPDNEPVMFTYLKKVRWMALPSLKVIHAGLEHEGQELHTFHPLCESMLTGESGTIRFLKTAIRQRLWQTAVELISTILKQGAENQPIKDSTYKRFLAAVCDGVRDPKIDDTLLASWAAVLAYISDNEKMPAKDRLRLVLSTNDKVNGEKYARVARYVNFTSQESDDGTANYFGVRCRRKQDKVILHRLMTIVFNWYPAEVGSNDNRANFAALSRGWATYVTEYNKVASALHEVYADVEVLDSDWIAGLESLDQFDKAIQTLPYNTGPAKEGEDNTHRDYGVKTNVLDLVKPETATALDKPKPAGGAQDPLAFFASRKPKALSGIMGSAFDVNNLTPAQRAEWERTHNLEREGTVKRRSLAESLGQPLPVQSPTLLGGLTQNQTLSGLLTGGGGLMTGGTILGGGLQLGQQSLTGGLSLGGNGGLQLGATLQLGGAGSFNY